MQPTIIPLDDRRLERASKAEAFQQAIAAVVLFSAGYDRFESSTGGALIFAAALIAAGGMLLWTAFRAFRGKVPWHPGLLNLAAGVALLTEWAVKLAADGGKIIKPSLVMAVLSLGLGLFHPFIERRRASHRFLRLDADGISYRRGGFRRFDVRWDALESISVLPKEILFQRRSGRPHRIPLRHLGNAAEVVEVVLSASRAAGIAAPLEAAALP
jgi:hypothetical protein